VPKLWDDTIEAHRRSVRDATMEATASLVAEHGLRSVTMSQIAKESGIARATLYKYFPDVEAILLAWHERQVANHLELLAGLGGSEQPPERRLEAVLSAYAHIQHQRVQHDRHQADLAALFHRADHVARAQQRLVDFVRDLLSEAAAVGHVRNDVPVEELARYSLHALDAATTMQSKDAVRRLVTVTLAGLRPGERDRAAG
jgi:AcrR family transcriptional regulator